MELGDDKLLLAMNRYGCEFVSHGILICAHGIDRDDRLMGYVLFCVKAHIDANFHDSRLRAGDKGKEG